MRLSPCLDGCARRIGDDVSISGIAVDSRNVEPGVLFAALKGTRVDGFDFVGEAIRRGATAILSDQRLADFPSTVTKWIASDPSRALASAAAAFWPNQPATICAITGTNGKSSTAEFLRQIWVFGGKRAASLGTLGLISPALVIDKSLTTPDPLTLHSWLDQLARTHVSHLALEASSHGMDQRRLDGVRPIAAAFTNLTQDHLDYHGTMPAYFAAKRYLFDTLLADNGTAVVNSDDPMAARIINSLKPNQRLIDFGLKAQALQLMHQTPNAHGQVITFQFRGKQYHTQTSLIGAFQAKNVLAAAALAIASGGDPGQTFASLGRLTGARGRMQHVGSSRSGAPVYVDYAHTPDALEQALIALRPHVERHITVVFGCGGDRDKGKRPTMGKIAAQHADKVIVTDDNPRSEDPDFVRGQILVACPGGIEIGDRTTAIAHGLKFLTKADALLVAGKGHETGQIVKDTVLPFDDISVCRMLIEDQAA